ncbi:hypothetical protein LNKW23_48510 [Paralimibaculum aggregatum]|uniref:Uncharacterized protein n=2 Tax=Paralimibaculum aggregatum TaxID=3036245 RepID=A0ABQ6LU50_9RHOB|nr:hypothetical protein LNKW23_48510 [Limibaculum sp. NKW23]
MLPNAIYVPLSDKVAEALEAVAPLAGVRTEQILAGILHPSGANNERIACFPGRKRNEELSVKTRPENIIAARDALMTKVSRLSNLISARRSCGAPTRPAIS